ncbi:MAG: glycosyltransferase family 2 protein [Methanosarcinales archaeon]|nr:glycosyltransferase family 2 protein [Methanosarcinales archaeon]
MVCLILPTKNEEACIGATIERIREICSHLRIVVVDGNSTDRTVEIASQLDVEVIFDSGLGKGEALRSAFNYVEDDVVFLDVDGTYPIELIPEFIKALDKYDLVVGERVEFTGDSLPKIFLIGDALSRGLFHLLYSKKVDNLSGMRAIGKQAIHNMSLESDGFGIETEITAKAVRMGLGITKIPIIYRARTGGSKFRPIHDGMVVLGALIRYRL